MEDIMEDIMEEFSEDGGRRTEDVDLIPLFVVIDVVKVTAIIGEKGACKIIIDN